MTHTRQRDADQSVEGPTTLPDFVRQFPTDEACVEFLFSLRWPDGFVCPFCGDTTLYRRKKKALFECANGHVISPTSGTLMHRSKLPLTTWFYGAYLVSTLTPGISALQFQKQLGLTRYETAFQLLHKLRSALVAPGREPLHGVVEVDEAYVGGREEGRRGRGTSKALVVIGVELVAYEESGKEKIRAGRVRASVRPDASAESLVSWVQENVEEGTRVRTDAWGAYAGLEALGYEHEPIAQSSKGKKTGRYLPMVHLIISNLKRWLMGTYKGAVTKKHLQAYLNEFVFRFNRRFWRGPAFVRALGLATMMNEHPEYETLYSGEWVHPNPEEE